MTLTVSVAQRRARLVQRQLPGPPEAVAGRATVGEVTAALLALHATDPVTVYLSAWARSRCTVEDVDAALYQQRSLVRILGMRRTMFVVPAGLAGLIQAACTDDVAARMRRGLVKDLAAGGVGGQDAGAWLRALEDGVVRALAARAGGASAAQLSADEPRLRTELVYAPGKSYGGPAYITSRVLMLMSADGLIIRGHRRGGWSSGQFEYFLPQAWLAGGDAAAQAQAVAAARGTVGASAGGGSDDSGPRGGVRLGGALDALDALDAGGARTELARRWLSVFGPAPRSDLRWWAGWTAGQAKAALAALPVTEVDLDGQDAVALTGDLEFPDAPAPAAALLPGLDPTPMGWQDRAWYLGEHGPALFDRTGNIGPSIWWEGRIVGGWAQRASGEVVCRLLEDIGANGAAAVSAQAAALETWLGASRVTPRFRTPLERELVA